jgi:uncharacterized membrane protein
MGGAMIPSRTDPVVRNGSEILGGPWGRLARTLPGPWPTISTLVVLATAGYMVGYLLDLSCVTTNWLSPDRYEHLCYSDIPALYGIRGFADGLIPYVQIPVGGTPLEYPVLTGMFMWVAALITTAIAPVLYSNDVTRAFFDVNVILLTPFLLITVIASALAVRHRAWDAAMIAVAPTVVLGATINWDLIPIALTALAFLAWVRERPVAAGVFLGLAIASKFYPLVLVAVFVLLAIRTRSFRPTLTLIGATGITWILVNLPFAIANFEGWWHFYSFNRARGVDFGSVWYAVTEWGLPRIPDEAINAVSAVSFLALLCFVAYIALTAPRTPTVFALAFLVLAAFVITSKVYSPQYVLWLVPFAALARPRWRDFLIWQTGEVIYFAAIWWLLAAYGVEGAKGLDGGWYALATFIHVGVTVWYAILIIRDLYEPTQVASSTSSKVDVVKRTSASS